MRGMRRGWAAGSSRGEPIRGYRALLLKVRKWGALEAGKMVRCASFYRRKIWGMEKLSLTQDPITRKSRRGYEPR